MSDPYEEAFEDVLRSAPARWREEWKLAQTRRKDFDDAMRMCSWMVNVNLADIFPPNPPFGELVVAHEQR